MEEKPKECKKGTLNSSLRGSMRVKSRSLGSPPTLWWDLIVWLCFCPLPGGGQDSITSGYKVPCNTIILRGVAVWYPK